MRRIVITVTALAVLGAGGAAIAATQFNSYSTTTSFSPNKAGSARKPSPFGFKQTYVANGTNGNRAAPLTDLRTTIYGAVLNGKGYPTCSLSKIAAAGNDTAHPSAGIASGPCPKNALLATASVNSLLGPGSDPSSNAQGVLPCNPALDAWNAGGGKIAFFFWTTTQQGSAHYCGGVKTGSTPPYQGTIRKSGKNLVIDVPLPPSVSTRVLGGNTWGSLIKEVITWKSLNLKIKGKNVPFFASVACSHGKRPWAQKFTASFNGNVQSATVTGSPKC